LACSKKKLWNQNKPYAPVFDHSTKEISSPIKFQFGFSTQKLN